MILFKFSGYSFCNNFKTKDNMWILYYIFLLVSLTQAEPSVHILSENLDQFVTSTTLEWVPSNGNDEAILKNGVIAAEQTILEERKDNELNEDGTADPTIVNKPVYVCRAKINSIWVPGQLRPKKHVCVVSLYKKVSEYDQFEILVNIEGSARLSWIDKNKYTLISQGAVTSGENALRSFIARRAANSHNIEGSLTYNVGKFTPSENLGVFHLVDQNNDELQFEDGQILVETEPIKYEIKYIKFERYRGRQPKIQKILGQATLKNEENGLQRVESVIGYKYNYSLFWGKGHGLLTGLPFTVFFPNGTHITGQWAIPTKEEKSDVAPVEQYLEEGTAANVTLIGNYTESEIPYNATVICIYKDGEKREIQIRDTKRENKIMDIVASYSPIYFLHNNSHVPTTTTTTVATTTSTRGTTSRATSTTQHVTPIISPEVISINKITEDQHGPSKNNENGNMLPDEQNIKNDASSIKMKNTKTQTSGVTPTNILSKVIVLLISLVIHRVT